MLPKGRMNVIRFISEHPFYVGVGVIAFVLSVFMLNFRRYEVSGSVESWGQFGDYLGGILNPVFGLVSVVIISATLRSQVRSSNKQEFDNQFFALLSLYDSVLQSIDRHSSRDNTVRKGRDCFYLFFKDIGRISTQGKISIEMAYPVFLQRRGWELEHYFRTVYHLFKHVKDGHAAGLVLDQDKKKYYDLIKSQISQYELILIWLNTQGHYKGNWDSLISDMHADPFEHLDKGLVSKVNLEVMARFDRSV